MGFHGHSDAGWWLDSMSSRSFPVKWFCDAVSASAGCCRSWAHLLAFLQKRLLFSLGWFVSCFVSWAIPCTWLRFATLATGSATAGCDQGWIPLLLLRLVCLVLQSKCSTGEIKMPDSKSSAVPVASTWKWWLIKCYNLQSLYHLVFCQVTWTACFLFCSSIGLFCKCSCAAAV